MKNIVTYLLISLVSLAFCYDTIDYLSRLIGSGSIVIIDDFDCEDKGQESEETEESKDKDEKVDFFHDFFLANHHVTYHSLGTRYHSQHNINFSSSDHSSKVFSPPELG